MNSSSLFGLLTRRERWGLSFRGWVVFLSSVLCLAVLCVVGAYPFLATTAPVDSDILIVEGWIGPNAFKAAANEIQSRHCTRVFTTGGPVDGYELDNSIYDTYAHQAFSRLLRCGISSNLITRVPAAHSFGFVPMNAIRVDSSFNSYCQS